MAGQTIRAKVSVGTVSAGRNGDEQTYESASMYGVKGESDNPEDNAFAKATPGLSISISIDNPACFGFFKQGKKYYVDFTEAPE